MPIRIPNKLPAEKILAGENIFVMNEKRALTQDIRPLSIVILNIMPTKITTETQLLRLLGNTPLQVNIQLAAMESHTSKNTPKEHLSTFYKTFDEIKRNKYDGMIITGAPIEQIDFEQVDYWDELKEIMEWTKTNVTSTMHICWGAQAGLYYHYGIPKYPLEKKMFGVFPHTLVRKNKMLTRGFDDVFMVPHSRHTEVREEGHEAWILASCYMLRTEKNADLIADIEGGIRREVSVGCAMGKATCSICGQPYGVCEHRKGERYGGQQCLAVLSEPTDAYEFSFVAVPAQRQAGVTKGRKGGVSMTLKELVTSTGTPEQQDSLRELEQAAQFGRVCRRELLDEVVRLGLVVDLGADEATLRKACAALELQELKAWRGALEQKAAALFPPQAQLPAAKGGAGKLDAAYMI